MECFNCNQGEDYIEQFYVEDFNCPHCRENIKMKFFLCVDCGAVWKQLGDEVVSGVVFNSSELSSAMGPEIERLFSMLDEDKSSRKETTGITEYFSNFVIECVRCKEKAYRIDDLAYKCSSCNFEWEVVDFE